MPSPWFFTCALLSASAAASGSVYRCQAGSEPVLFSQFRCPDGAVEQLVEPTATSIVEIPGLSPDEQKAVAELERTLLARRREHRQQRKRQQRNAAAMRAEARRQCNAALQGLKQLREHKRHGYSAADSNRLGEREASLQNLRKENC